MFESIKYFVFFLTLLNLGCAHALKHSSVSTKLDGLHLKTFGNNQNQALIFIHGGPGFNSYNFEVTTAKALSDRNFFVVTYDQRGQGRSEACSSNCYNYQTYSNDLMKMISLLRLEKPILIGHSHGGQIAIKFEQHHPGIAKRIILVDAPISFPGIIDSIFTNCLKKYQVGNMEQKATEISFLYKDYKNRGWSKTDSNFVGLLFYHGLMCGTQGGLYIPQLLEQNAKDLYQYLAENLLQEPVRPGSLAMIGFMVNEQYISLNHGAFVEKYRKKFRGIYGAEDGLFTKLELALIRSSLEYPGEPKRFKVIEGASHNVFIDKQEEFLDAIEMFSK